MTVEEYKKNRKSRLQRLKEAVESMPEVKDDGKANIQIDPALGAALETDRERDQNTKELFKDKNEETREFIKDQDKAREKEADIDKEDKSENRLTLDESLFTETVDMTPDFNPRDLIHKMWALSDAFDALTEYAEENNIDADDFFTTNYPFDLSLDEVASHVSYWCDTAQELLVDKYGEDFWESMKRKPGKALKEDMFSDPEETEQLLKDIIEKVQEYIDEEDPESNELYNFVDDCIEDALYSANDVIRFAYLYDIFDYDDLRKELHDSLFEDIFDGIHSKNEGLKESLKRKGVINGSARSNRKIK